MCILHIALVVLSISFIKTRIMIILFQHLNRCSNSCWLLFNNNKQHHWISISSYTFDFDQRLHLLLSSDNMFKWSVQRVHWDASCDVLLSSGPVHCIRSFYDTLSTIMIILYICGVGDGDCFKFNHQQSWSFCTSMLLVIVITVTLLYQSLWFNCHFILIQVKSCHVCWIKFTRWLLYYIVSIAIMIYVISIFKSIFLIQYQLSWSFCTSMLLVMVNNLSSNDLSLWVYLRFYFDSSQVKSSVLDQVYMVIILPQVIVLLHDPDYWQLRLYILLHEYDFLSLCLPTPYPIRCYWWPLLYYVVSITIMIHVISIPCLLRI